MGMQVVEKWVVEKVVVTMVEVTKVEEKKEGERGREWEGPDGERMSGVAGSVGGSEIRAFMSVSANRTSTFFSLGTGVAGRIRVIVYG